MTRLLTVLTAAAVMLAVDIAARAGPWEWVWLATSFGVGFVTALALLEEEPKR